MSSKSAFDRVLSAVFALSAVVVAAVVVTVAVRREFFPPGEDPSDSITEPIPVNNWDEIVASGQVVGPDDAPATIVVFADFECPACRQFALGPLQQIREQYEDDVRVIYRHWPLPYHRFAYPAARASECAAEQGRFEAYHDLLFEKQDSLGIKTFTEFAIASDIPNIQAFDECNARTDPLAVITADSAAARRVGGTGTPTVLINGLRLPRTRMLDSLVRAAIDGELEAPSSDTGATSRTLTPWDSVPEIGLVPELRIDGAAADLGRVGRIAVSEDGSMAVSEPRTSSLVVFNADGVRLDRFGRAGSETSQVAVVAEFGWLGDTLWMYDRTREQLIYGRTLPARVVRTTRLPRQGVPSVDDLPLRFARVLPLALYPDGSIYASAVVPEDPPELSVSTSVRHYVRINPEGQVSRVIAEAPRAPYVIRRTATGFHSARIPLAYGALHEVSADGGYVATVQAHIEGPHGGSFQLVLQGALGDTIYTRDYPFVGVPVPPSLADSLLEARAEGIESRSREMARFFREEAPIPPVYHPVLSLAVGNDGTVAVGLRGEDNEGTLLLLDPCGVPLGVAPLPEPARVAAVDASNVWVVQSDKSGVEGLVRYGIGGSAGPSARAQGSSDRRGS